MLSGTAEEKRVSQRHGKRLVVEESEEEASGAEIFSGEEAQREASGSDDEKDVFTQAKTQLEEALRHAVAESRFNPHPDEEQVRSLRHGYAKLLGEARSQKSELVKAESTRLVEMMNDANELLGMVHTTVDATLDSRFIAQAADLGAEKISKMASGALDFGVTDFCMLARSALIRSAVPMPSATSAEEELMGDETTTCSEQYDWDVLGTLAMRRWRGVTGIDMLLGPITVEPKEKRPRAKTTRERPTVGPAVEPLLLKGKEANDLATGAATETTSNVITVYQTLVQVAPVPFYRFICNPHSFARTVENLFYVSFLANDNRVRLGSDALDSAEMIIHVVGDEDDQGDGDSEEVVPPKHQAIYSMTMSRWRNIISKYGIEAPMIPL